MHADMADVTDTMSRLGQTLNLKGHWVGKSTGKVFMYGPGDLGMILQFTVSTLIR